MTLSSYFSEQYPPAAIGLGPYAADNIARFCARCLSVVDQEAAAAGVAPGDLLWADGVFLSPNEVVLGHQLSPDFFGPKGVAISDQIGCLLSSATPAIGQFARLGLIGWYELNPPDPLPRFMALLVIFETLYRLVSHLHGIDVLQRDNRNKRYQYKMLDETGLCAAPVLERLLMFLPERNRPTATRVLLLAVKTRNAIAHGVCTFPADTFDGAGHLIAKSMHVLVASALHHMTQEAAYYRYLNLNQCVLHNEVKDWLWAQRHVLAMIGS